MRISLAIVSLAVATASTTFAAYDVNKVIAAARSQKGVPYVWGGGHGPKPGKTKGGFDCSGLVRYAVFRGSGIDLGRGGNTDSQLRDRHTKQIPCAQRRAGDLIFWGTKANTYHVALFSGNGKMIEAQKTGVPIHEVKYRAGNICARVR